jgi:hypothetical protein
MTKFRLAQRSAVTPAYSPFHCGDLCHAYNEAAFHHFLALERRRAERLARPLLLILVHARDRSARHETLEARYSTLVFDALGECVREVDFVGWYRENRVAAAVVSTGAQVPSDLRQRLQRRVESVLAARLALHELDTLRVRIAQLQRRSGH